MIEFDLKRKVQSGDGELLLDVQAKIETGQLVALDGPSGAGKTSILRMLAGLMKPDEGMIKINNNSWFDSANNVNLKPQTRSIGFVFQDYALFPNMNVRENIAFALPKGEATDIVEELLEITGLRNFSTRKIQTLSGGQQQRVALARALARKPEVLLLDEPLSAIDPVMRSQLQEVLANVHKRYNLTTLLVSHSRKEIARLADIVLPLVNGKFQPSANPVSFFHASSTRGYVAGTITSIENDVAIVRLNEKMNEAEQPIPEFAVNDKVRISLHGK